MELPLLLPVPCWCGCHPFPTSCPGCTAFLRRPSSRICCSRCLGLVLSSLAILQTDPSLALPALPVAGADQVHRNRAHPVCGTGLGRTGVQAAAVYLSRSPCCQHPVAWELVGASLGAWVEILFF